MKNFFNKKVFNKVNDNEAQGAASQGSNVNNSANGTNKTVRVHNLLIIDESGSMQAIYDATLSGINETLQTIREAQNEHPDQRHTVSLVTFDTTHYNRCYDNVPAEKAIDLTNAQYRPYGGTPLFDAVGRALSETRAQVNNDDIVLVTIITDGYENASREFSLPAIKALIESLSAQGWVFSFIGANIDVNKVASSMSIKNSMAFEATDAKAKEMWARENCNRKTFFSRVSKGESRESLKEGFFKE